MQGISDCLNPNRSLDFGEIARLCHAACFSPSRRRSGLRRRMRTEAGKMPESLTFPIKNGLGVSNDRFGLKVCIAETDLIISVLCGFRWALVCSGTGGMEKGSGFAKKKAVCRNGQSPILIHRRRCRGEFESGTASSIGTRTFRDLSYYSRLEASLTSTAACR